MERASSVVVLCMGLASAVACGDASVPSGSSASAVVEGFHDGVWVLAVDRALRTGIPVSGVPTAPLSEADFAAVVEGKTYRLAVSERAKRIEVAEPRLVGRLEQASAGRATYDVVEGAFAGGRIVVWREVDGLQGELTIYGSGVPVVRSERGLVREAQ